MNDNPVNLTRFAWISIGASLLTIGLKTSAYLLTGSIGLLSDAVESVINLLAGLMALWMLKVAAQPPDESHLFGHRKAEYFSSAVEGVLILIAAISIAISAAGRLITPQALEKLGVGLGITVAASLINLIAARILLHSGKKHNSITLEADGQHLMTDVWTSAGVLIGVGIVAMTGWYILDPIIAILVAINILWTGYRLLQRSIAGLMDSSLPPEEIEKLEAVLDTYRSKGMAFHALRTRQAAALRFVSVHVLVPGTWTVHDAHHIAEDIEQDIRNILGTSAVFTHLEPIDDEISNHDIRLERHATAGESKTEK